MSPKFSLIVPVYNTGAYLTQCAESLLGQTFSDYELILVDDGSSDNAPALCDAFAAKDARVRTIHQKNKGLSEARNQGIDMACGEFLIFCDSDDYWLDKNALQAIFEASESADVVMFDGQMVYCNNHNEITSVKRLRMTDALRGAYPNGGALITDALKRNPVFPWYCILYAFRRDMWLNAGLRFPPGRYYEDAHIIYRVLLNASVIRVLPRVVYAYRKAPENGITGSVRLKPLQDQLRMCSEQIAYLNADAALDDEVKELLLQNFSSNYFGVMINAPDLPPSEFAEILRELQERKSLMKYASSGKQLLAKYLAGVVGIKNAARLLNIRKKIIVNDIDFRLIYGYIKRRKRR